MGCRFLPEISNGTVYPENLHIKIRNWLGLPQNWHVTNFIGLRRDYESSPRNMIIQPKLAMHIFSLNQFKTVTNQNHYKTYLDYCETCSDHQNLQSYFNICSKNIVFHLCK